MASLLNLTFVEGMFWPVVIYWLFDSLLAIMNVHSTNKNIELCTKDWLTN